jgi:hypothetical protein
VERFFGGRPSKVLLKLALASVVVGLILHLTGFDINNIWRTASELVYHGINNVLTFLDWSWRYFLLGAVAVIFFPVWLVMRLITLPKAPR